MMQSLPKFLLIFLFSMYILAALFHPILILVYLVFVILGYLAYRLNRIPPPPPPKKVRRLGPIPRVTRKHESLFFTLPDSHSMCKLFQPGVKESDWKPCEIEVLPTYVALYTGSWLLRKPSIFKALNTNGARKQPAQSRWRRPTLTFNAGNMRWIGHIQHIDETVSELCLDLDVDGIWYTLWVRMFRHDARDFASALDQIAPDSLHTKRNRLRPNVRHAPVQAHPKSSEDHNWQSDKPVELYVTPLYLVVLVNTFVACAIPVDSITAFNVVISPDLPGDWRWLELITTSGTLNYAIPFSPQLEERLAQAIHRDRPPSKTQTA
jgi:hypothetical protein